MRVELLLVGDELLSGQVRDVHLPYFAMICRDLGATLNQVQVIPDEVPAIVAALRAAHARSQVVLVTGGLGPTSDDLTMTALADFLGRPLSVHPEARRHIERWRQKHGRTWQPLDERTATLPLGVGVFENPAGTAPHVQVEVGQTRFFFFPGVPREVRALTAMYFAPWLRAHQGEHGVRRLMVKCFGAGEGEISERLAALEARWSAHPSIQVAWLYRAVFPEVHLVVKITAATEGEADGAREALQSEIEAALGPLIYSQEEGETLAAVVGALLAERGESLSVAESCTGGLLGSEITQVPGASRYFFEGFLTYSNDAKVARLGVSPESLASHGAVSLEVAREMAVGARRAAGATWALAITGIAGPGGGSPEKPVGTIWFALAGPGLCEVVRQQFPYDRRRNQVMAAAFALDLLRRQLKK